MSFQMGFCPACHNRWEYYQKGTVMPACPACGGLNGKDKKDLHKAYYKSFGIDCQCFD